MIYGFYHHNFLYIGDKRITTDAATCHSSSVAVKVDKTVSSTQLKKQKHVQVVRKQKDTRTEKINKVKSR